jgi:hypothetical protein
MKKSTTKFLVVLCAGCLLLSLLVSCVYAGDVVAKVKTNKEVYIKGEPIEIQLIIENSGGNLLTKATTPIYYITDLKGNIVAKGEFQHLLGLLIPNSEVTTCRAIVNPDYTIFSTLPDGTYLVKAMVTLSGIINGVSGNHPANPQVLIKIVSGKIN